MYILTDLSRSSQYVSVCISSSGFRVLNRVRGHWNRCHSTFHDGLIRLRWFTHEFTDLLCIEQLGVFGLDEYSAEVVESVESGMNMGTCTYEASTSTVPWRSSIDPATTTFLPFSSKTRVLMTMNWDSGSLQWAIAGHKRDVPDQHV